MALAPLTSPRVLRRFCVYDLEWVPGSYQLRCAGFFDGIDYRYFGRMSDLLNHMLSSRYRGYWHFAHFGGQADSQFITHWVMQNQSRFHLEASFSSSSAIIIDVRDRHRNKWTLCDSGWLLKEPLAKIAKSIGMRKASPDFVDDADSTAEEKLEEWYAKVPLGELVEYNEIDCRILYEAIRLFEIELWDMGGQLQKTLAGTALNLFRRKYLKEPIETYAKVNQFAEPAYNASRVEVVERYVHNANFFDINSSFPSSMTLPAPGNLIAVDRELPDNTDLYIADVDVKVPSSLYIPPLPLKFSGEGRTFFPVGRWRGTYCGVDLQFLEEMGGTIEKVHRVMHFEPFMDMRDYALDLYAKRIATMDPFRRMLFKLLLNSLYGKMGERSEKSGIIYNPTIEQLGRMDPNDYILPGIYRNERVVHIPHAHVPIAAHITALSRKLLLDKALPTGRVHYFDTDGFSTMGMAKCGDALGELKHEKVIHEAEFLAPKTYRITGAVNEGNTWKPIEIIKAKGMSLSRNAGQRRREWDKLVKGHSVLIRRMRRHKEALRDALDGDANPLMPCDKYVSKRLSDDRMPKRFEYNDGTTRPWHHDELLRIFVK